MSLNSKVSIGVGAACILLGAVSLGIGLGIWCTYIGYIFMGIIFILSGISFNIGGRGQKVIRDLRFYFAGVALVFLVIGLVTLLRS